MLADFIEAISLHLAELPGESAHELMAPVNAGTRRNYRSRSVEPRKSAVLVLFYPSGDGISTLLILRNKYPGVHSAQVSFPGGKVEEDDASPEAAAAREASEEVGITAADLHFIGRLSELYIPPSNFLVQPVLAAMHYEPSFRPDVSEVQQIIPLPLRLLLDDTIVKSKPINISILNREIEAPYFDITGHVVWGATAMMLSELKHVISQPGISKLL